MDALFHKTAHDLRREIAARRIGVAELTALYLHRIEAYQPRLNAVAEIDETALSQARALDNQQNDRNLPLWGLPVLIKDNIDVCGLHTTAGSVALADNVARADAPIIARLRQSGAIILGKTNMTEFANYAADGMPNGFSSRGGQVKNAYLPDKDPGGSSTGSAVAVSAGLCAAAIGTDTCFSIVGCAADNGVTGLKPAGGSLPSRGIIPICYALDTAGPLTRDFSDALLVYNALRERPLPDCLPAPVHNLRIAVNTFGRDQVSAAQLARYDALFASLRRAGATLTEITQPAASECRRAVMRYAFKHDLEAYLAASCAQRKTLSQIIDYYHQSPEARMPYGISVLENAQRVASGRLDEPAYQAALAERDRLRAQVLCALRDVDACVMTGPTDIMHVVNLPCVALRLCMAEDAAPRGVILYGADEQRLFAAARTIEAHCPGVTPPDLP